MRTKTRCEVNKYNVSHSGLTNHASLCLTVLFRVIIPRTKAVVYMVLPTCGSSFRRGGNKIKLCVISGFRREVDEICALLGYYAEERRSHVHCSSDLATKTNLQAESSEAIVSDDQCRNQIAI